MEKSVKTSRISKVASGDSVQYNRVLYRTRELKNLRAYGRPRLSTLRLYSGYSVSGSKRSLERMLAINGLEPYALVGGLFGRFRPTGGPSVSQSKGLGLVYEVFLHKKGYLFFADYYYHQYTLEGTKARQSGFVSSLYMDVNYTYNQHYVSLGAGKAFFVPLLNTELRLKAGLVFLGTKLSNINQSIVVGESGGLTTQKMRLGLLGEADLKLWANTKIDILLEGRYFSVPENTVGGAFTSSSAPIKPWVNGFISNRRLLVGLSAGFKF